MKKTAVIATAFNKFWTPEPYSNCWLWTGTIFPSGYGGFNVPGNTKQKASRVSWKIYRGDIPLGICVLHKCDNKLCVNPDHLFLGTQRDNMRDKVFKNRQLSGEDIPQSKLTDEQVLAIRGSSLLRREIACQYGISETWVTQIKQRKWWKHI